MNCQSVAARLKHIADLVCKVCKHVDLSASSYGARNCRGFA
jgi:hypothetical protein